MTTYHCFQWEKSFLRLQESRTTLKAENRVILLLLKSKGIGKESTQKVSIVSKMPWNTMKFCSKQTNSATMLLSLAIETVTTFLQLNSVLISIRPQCVNFLWRKRRCYLWGWINSTTSIKIKINSCLNTLKFSLPFSKRHHLVLFS